MIMTQVRLACSHQTSDPTAANLLFADSVKFVLTVGCRLRTTLRSWVQGVTATPDLRGVPSELM